MTINMLDKEKYIKRMCPNVTFLNLTFIIALVDENGP